MLRRFARHDQERDGAEETPFKGADPAIARAAAERLDRKWKKASLYKRRARVTGVKQLTNTGTLKLSFEVIDDGDFDFEPGQFLGIEHKVAGRGYRRSPYCILSPPDKEESFELLIRLVPHGPLSLYLGSLDPGDVIRFRGPTGRSMIPKEPDTELILLATGVGVGPFHSLARHLLSQGFERPIRLFWGLRLVEDICLVDELDDLALTYDHFSYQVSLSQPPPEWPGLRGRLTESLPPLLETLGRNHFYLCGNGAMIEEMSTVLSDLGVPEQLVYKEAYFNFKHRSDAATLDEIRARFRAHDLFSPLADRRSRGLELAGASRAQSGTPAMSLGSTA